MTAHAFTLNTSCSKHTRGQWLTDEHYPVSFLPLQCPPAIQSQRKTKTYRNV
ncbi:hypothetical protein BFJ70_g2904 [Fusarium oxysporum]|nr:hypothetical protein BFJ70_g2904 [Fusarium oxysporum]